MTGLHEPAFASNRRWSDCPECADYFKENAPSIIHAAASVGIEHGLTTNQALAVYMRQKHESDHVYE